MVDTRWRGARRILLVRLDNLGDVLVTTPAFHAVKRALPEAKLTLLASPVGAQVASLDPDLADVIVYRAPWMDPWQTLPHNSQREQQTITTIKEQHFDGAIIFTSFRQSPLPAAYLCYLANIPLRAAASLDGPGSLLTTRHKHPERMMHEVERALDLVAALDIHTSECDLVLQVPLTVQKSIIAHLSLLAQPQHRSLVVVHPGCSMPARTYPWEMYRDVIALLVTHGYASVVVTGSLEERPLAHKIMTSLPVLLQHHVQNLAGTLTFAEFCALIQTADVMITNNTGPMHIAAAVKTPVVVLFALTNPPEQWGPWHVPHRILFHDVSCRTCYNRVCPYAHECLCLVTPEMVCDAATELLSSCKESGSKSSYVAVKE